MKKITLEVLDERLTNWFRENKEDHDTIIVQTTKTNGRVNELDKWKSQMTGAMIILNVVIWPIVLLFITKVL
jgi:hypothetical protein